MKNQETRLTNPNNYERIKTNILLFLRIAEEDWNTVIENLKNTNEKRNFVQKPSNIYFQTVASLGGKRKFPIYRPDKFHCPRK